MVLGVCLQNTQSGVWNITPDIGSAIALFGQQIVTSQFIDHAKLFWKLTLIQPFAQPMLLNPNQNIPAKPLF